MDSDFNSLLLRLSLPKAVLQLAWRPVDDKDENTDGYDLAIAGEDNSLRIYKVKNTEMTNGVQSEPGTL